MDDTVPRPPLDSISHEDGCSTIVVDSLRALESLLANLTGLPPRPPSIYLDAVGIATGQLAEFHILIHPKSTLYIVKMKRLGAAALSTASGSTSLRHIFESKSIPKVAFDLRGLSGILFHQYSVFLDGMYDLQLMELASRNTEQPKKYLAGFKKCIDQDIPSTNATKQRWLQPEYLTNMHLFNSLGHAPRSSMKRIELYPSLWEVYRGKLGRPGEAFWLHHARYYSNERVRDSKENRNKPGKQSLGPETWWNSELREASIDDWNDELIMEARAGDNRLDEDANWVPVRSFW